MSVGVKNGTKVKLLPQSAKMALAYLTLPLFFVAGIAVATIARCFSATDLSSPRLVWGTTPIINFSYWSRAMAGSAPGLVDVSNVGGRSQEGCRNAEAFPAGVQA
jgi:hypothetical protein